MILQCFLCCLNSALRILDTAILSGTFIVALIVALLMSFQLTNQGFKRAIAQSLPLFIFRIVFSTYLTLVTELTLCPWTLQAVEYNWSQSVVCQAQLF